MKLKVTPSFCFAFKIPDDPTATSKYLFTFYTVYSMLFLHTL